MSSPHLEVPPGAAITAFVLFSMPLLGSLAAPDAAAQLGPVVWVLTLAPAGLLAYHRGIAGASVASMLGLFVVGVTQVVVAATGISGGNWRVFLLTLPAFLCASILLGLGAGALRKAHDRARGLDLVDHATSLPNYRAAEMFLDREFAAAQRGRPVTVVLFSLDRPRPTSRGTALADGEIVREFGQILQEKTRRISLSARWNSADFISVLSESDLGGTRIFVDKVRADLTRNPVTASCGLRAGIASYRPGMTSAADLLRAAEQALEDAKRENVEPLRLFPDGSEMSAAAS